MTTILNGKELAKELRNEIKLEVAALLEQGHRPPHLAAILVGTDGASMTYVNSKERDCEFVGFKSTVLRLDESETEEGLIDKIEAINNDPDIDGLIVQLPLPSHINSDRITDTISPDIDVDGFHTISVGKLAKGMDTYVSATPFGIIKLLESYKVDTSGKHCVVIGRSNIVGRPMSILMSANSYPGNSTVTICHSRTSNLKEICKSADIIIAALGKPEFVSADMVKEGATVIDVGITRVPADNEKGYRLAGDVDFDAVKDKAEFITPVPGGVGPMTRYGLLYNTLKSYKIKAGIK
ncbi:bifunctional 5,10-methylenetetrahydrofolate dehydrogenase/5,10-methenyltetrahydrofolate cyclohydrolase [bacterium]|nr:bifunctional 5,10-methylenetetrahydrofolate dehydrogenase/5,10-methenyltetrahydrofolate cyclohydrolase [bacterium]